MASDPHHPAQQNTGLKQGRTANLTNAGKGRPKGTPNKTTTIAKDAIAKAFDGIGGIDALILWAGANDENRKVFYSTIYPKLLPLQVTGEGGGPVAIQVRRIVEDPKALPNG